MMNEQDVVVTIDDGGLIATLNGMIQKAKNFRPLLKMFQVLMIRSFDLNFRYEGRPKKWAPLKKATPGSIIWGILELKIFGTRLRPTGILKKTGRLRLSAMTESVEGNITKFSSDSLKMGTSVPYANYLQEGTKYMPARPFIIIQKEDAEEMQRLTAKFFME